MSLDLSLPTSTPNRGCLLSPILPQAIGNALCATGFGESIAGVISDVHHPIAERAIAAIVIILLTLVNLVSNLLCDSVCIRVDEYRIQTECI